MEKLTKAQQLLLDEFEINGPIHVLENCFIMVKSGRTAHKRVVNNLVNNLVEKKYLAGGDDALIEGAAPQTLVRGESAIEKTAS